MDQIILHHLITEVNTLHKFLVVGQLFWHHYILLLPRPILSSADSATLSRTVVAGQHTNRLCVLPVDKHKFTSLGHQELVSGQWSPILPQHYGSRKVLLVASDSATGLDTKEL